MCNIIHLKSREEIPAEGNGWKVFSIVEGFLMPMFHCGKFKVNEWHEWDTGEYWGSGFCFFLDYKEAERCLMDCVDDANRNPLKKGTNRVIRWAILPVEYKQGLGSCLEDNIVGQKKYRVALAKEIKPILK